MGEWRIQYFAYIVLSFSPHVRACYVIYTSVNIITSNTFIHGAILWMLIHNNSIGLYLQNQVIAADLNWMPFSCRVSMTEKQIACELILKMYNITEMCCLRGKQYDNSIISVAKFPNALKIYDLSTFLPRF